jgi:hypothetical protein
MSVQYFKTWSDLDSIKGLLQIFEASKPSVISINMGGNDFRFVKEIFENEILPIFFICEYNVSLGPNVEFIQSYNAKYNWGGSNYYGASLKSYNDLFDSYNYSLAACNLTGGNAFFIRNNNLDNFKDVSRNTDEPYVHPVASIPPTQGINNKRIIQKILSNSKHKNMDNTIRSLDDFIVKFDIGFH